VGLDRDSIKNITILVAAFGLAIAALAYIFATDDTTGSRTDTQRSTEPTPHDSRTTTPPPKERSSEAPDTPGEESKVEEPETDPAVDAATAERESILLKLRSKETTASEQSKLWRRLGGLGMADEAIAAIRAELKVTPRDADLHTMLGNALVTKMRTEKLNPLERRAASMEAMSEFNTALDIDPQNWTARFSRAMSNSNAPAFLGLQTVAIKDFETLVEQQKASPASKDHAHTYFFLSNLHQGSGNTERANAVRAEARELFPDDPRFKDGE